MYKLPDDIKKLLKWVIIASPVISIIFLIFKPFYALAYTIGWIVSILNVFKNNFFLTNAVYSSPQKAKGVGFFNYILTMILFMVPIGIFLYLDIITGFICFFGVLMVKIMVIILFGFTGKEGNNK